VMDGQTDGIAVASTALAMRAFLKQQVMELICAVISILYLQKAWDSTNYEHGP